MPTEVKRAVYCMALQTMQPIPVYTVATYLSGKRSSPEAVIRLSPVAESGISTSERKILKYTRVRSYLQTQHKWANGLSHDQFMESALSLRGHCRRHAAHNLVDQRSQVLRRLMERSMGSDLLEHGEHRRG